MLLCSALFVGVKDMKQSIRKDLGMRSIEKPLKALKQLTFIDTRTSIISHFLAFLF